VRHVAVSFVVAFIGLTAMAWVVPGIHIRDFEAAVLAVLVFWALNLFFRPVALALFAPISTALVVLVSLVLQVVVIFLLGPLTPGVDIDDVGAAFWGSWSMPSSTPCSPRCSRSPTTTPTSAPSSDACACSGPTRSTRRNQAS